MSNIHKQVGSKALKMFGIFLLLPKNRQLERLHERVDDLNGQVDRLQDINRKQTEQYKNDLRKKDDEIEALKKQIKDLQNKS